MKIFVSHADADKLIALPFVELLRHGVKISDIFCSSTKGAIPNGQFFVQHILSELHTLDCTVSLLSPNYLKSQFCIAELGSAVVAQFRGAALFNSFTVPPTKFQRSWWDAFGIQSEFLDDPRLWKVCAQGSVASHRHRLDRCSRIFKVDQTYFDRERQKLC